MILGNYFLHSLNNYLDAKTHKGIFAFFFLTVFLDPFYVSRFLMFLLFVKVICDDSRLDSLVSQIAMKSAFLGRALGYVVLLLVFIAIN